MKRTNAVPGGRRWRRSIALAGLLVAVAASPASAHETLRARGAPLPDDESLLTKRGTIDTRSVNHVEGGWLELESVPSEQARFTRSRIGLASLLDGDPNTEIVLARGSSTALTTVYAGAAEWTNQLEIRLRGDAHLAVDVLRHDGTYKSTGVEIVADERDPFSVRTEIVDLPAEQVQGVRLRLVDGDDGRVEVKEIGAYWNDPELAKDNRETANEYAEDYPGTDNDLSTPDKTVRRFSDYLNDRGWTWLFDWGGANAWEQDYKRADLGGTNQDWIDATDIFIHCSHGTDDALFMARTDRDDTLVSSGDINDAWGNRDLEWAFFHCCLNMKTLAWHNALNGAHAISGWKNVINGSKNWGKKIAKKLWDNGLFDSAETIYQSWWQATKSHQPASNIGRLIVEDRVHFDEYIHGQGPVEADSDDSEHWYVERTGKKANPDADVWFARSDPRGDQPVRWEAPPHLGKAGENEVELYVHPSALDDFRAKRVEAVSRFSVVPSDLSSETIAQRLQRLCEVLGADCPTLEGGVADETEVAAAAGLKTLSGAVGSGALFYTDNEVFRLSETEPRTVIDVDTAAQIARSLLSELEFGPSTLEPIAVETQLATQITGEAPDIRVLEQFPIAQEVIFAQQLGGQTEPLPLLGPGGRAHVLLGPEGELQALNMVARRIQLEEVVPPVDVEQVLDQLAAFGYRVVDTAPEFPAQRITVRNIGLGYLERGAFDEQPTIGPVYALDVELTNEGPLGKRVTETSQLWIVADTPPVDSQILGPQDGANVPSGETIEFAGQAAGGTPPYSYEWTTSLIEGVLSTEPQFATDQLGAAIKETGSTEPVTVTLEVTDSNGNAATQVISLVFAEATDAGTAPTSRSALHPAAPNPFNPRTVLSFDLERKADVTLRVFDVRGRLVQTVLDDEQLSAGRHSRVWNGTDAAGRPVAAGVYLYRLEATVDGKKVFGDERKMTLVK